MIGGSAKWISADLQSALRLSFRTIEQSENDGDRHLRRRSDLEATHWWFTERRRFFGRIIQRLPLSVDAHILDIGTSTALICACCVISVFRSSKVWTTRRSRALVCRERLRPSHCWRHLPISVSRCEFDLVLATDVIEHVDDDTAALREIRRVLKPGGHALITVPAFQSLWGVQDEIGQHKRRYPRRRTSSRNEAAGLSICKKFYFNYFLFLPILATRHYSAVTGARAKRKRVEFALHESISENDFSIRCMDSPGSASAFRRVVSRRCIARRPT